MKKFTPLLFLLLFLFAAGSVNAQAISETCFPAVECDGSDDYYAESCQTRIDTVSADCPAPGTGLIMNFSCTEGCYETTVPVPLLCPGGVIISGSCYTLIDLVDFAGSYYIWDGVARTVVPHVTAPCADGESPVADAASSTGWSCGTPGLWLSDGTDVWRSAGDVGIGTTTPDATLDVENTTVSGVLEAGNSFTLATGTNSVAIGETALAQGSVSVALGRAVTASGVNAFAAGWQSTASGDFSTAMGRETTASGDQSTALGFSTVAASFGSTALGWDTDATASYSTALGWGTDATGNYSTAIGHTTTAQGLYSTAMGSGTIASGDYSTSSGLDTSATGNYSFAAGNNTSASRASSVAFGQDSIASGQYALAAGFTSSASGDSSVSLGFRTIASGDASIAIGDGAIATADQSAAIGMNAYAQAYRSAAVGSFNVISGSETAWVATDPIFAVGNGLNIANRSNALTVLKNGNVGVGVDNPNYNLDTNGSINIGVGAGSALLVLGNEAISRGGGYYTWGSGGSNNYFPNRIGIGVTPTSPTRTLYVRRSGAEISTTYASYNYNNNSDSGNTYASYNNAQNSDFGDTYGIYTRSRQLNNSDTNTAYGLYSYAYNPSSACGGSCGDAYGIYATTTTSPLGTGVYGEAQYIGGHFVGLAGGSAVGLYVDNQDPGGLGAIFECTGACTSAIFRGGNDAAVGTFDSGYVIIGQSNSAHLALDNNEIMAKSDGGNPATLFLNNGSTGNVSINMAQNSYSSTVCRSGETLGYCSSLRELKDDIKDLELGLETAMNLRPVAFDWKDTNVLQGKRDLGFIAEEVEEISPLIAEYDDEGDLSGVKYRQLTAVLTKAIQEQQVMIDELTEVVCADNPTMSMCKK